MEHLKQIQRAVDYIEEGLSGELPVESIARAAGFPMWHFQRVFCSTVGSPLKDYIRRRRLSRALGELGSSDRRILEIALDAGFESQEAFTKAFKATFGKNPGECRRDGIQSVLVLAKPRITLDYLDHLYGGLTMEPKIIQTPERKFVGLGAHFISILSPDANNFAVIPPLWDRFNAQRETIPNRTDLGTDIGLCEGPSGERRSHPDECYYMACAEVRDFEGIPEGMVTRTVPAGRYALFTHRGSLEKLGMTMNYIYGSWLARSGEKLREAPDLEVYGERFAFNSPDSELDILIPLQ